MNTDILIKDVIRQENGQHTIVFTNGDRQENVGVCLHGEVFDGGDALYYRVCFEVVPDFNPIIKAEKEK